MNMDKELNKLILQEQERQNNGIELIASENYTSKDVREACGSILINKYAEVICNIKDDFHRINCFCLKEIINLIYEAKKKNTGDVLTIPEFGSLVSMDTNDIIKKKGGFVL